MCKVSVIVPVYNVENYIRDMLLSVQNQTFKDFEVILINDGSPDNSQSIIEEFCRADKRFKCFNQPNGGVAAARNNGISKAKGDYLVFYDPDDYIPPRALEKMYKVAVKNEADLVIGVLRESSLGERRYNAGTVNLGKKKVIGRFDKNLLWSFSVCNKLFKKKFIMDNNIFFPKLKHAEDAVFLFNAIFKAQKIAGCNTCVYEYKLRPFWSEKSATQVIKYDYLKDVVEALDEIERIIKKNSTESIQDNNSVEKQFLDEFYTTRYLEKSLFVGYYRQFWALDEACLKLIHDKTLSLRKKITNDNWNRIVAKNKDLQLDKEIFSKDAAIENALLSFIIKPDISDEALMLSVNSIYSQSMPFFKVYVDNKYKDEIMSNGLYRENMFFYRHINDINIDTAFFMNVDERILFSKNSIKMMVNSMLADRTLDFTTVPIKYRKEDELIDGRQICAFTTLKCLKGKHSKYDRLDCFIGNKVFRTEKFKYLTGVFEPFDYGNMNFKKIYNAYMISTYDLSEDYESIKGLPSRMSIKVKCAQKHLEDKIIDVIKNHFTKEDLKRIIKKL